MTVAVEAGLVVVTGGADVWTLELVGVRLAVVFEAGAVAGVFCVFAAGEEADCEALEAIPTPNAGALVPAFESVGAPGVIRGVEDEAVVCRGSAVSLTTGAFAGRTAGAFCAPGREEVAATGAGFARTTANAGDEVACAVAVVADTIACAVTFVAESVEDAEDFGSAPALLVAIFGAL